MALGTGTHWQAPLLGGAGLEEEVPADVQSRRFRAVRYYDFNEGTEFVAASWTTTQIGATGTAAQVSGTQNGILRVTSGAVDDAGIGQLQNNISWLNPSTTNTADGLENRIIAYGARVAVSDFSVADWFFGLGTFDTTFMLATGALAATGFDNGIGFHHVAEATAQGGITGPDGNDVRLVSAGTAVANYQGTLLSAANQPKPVPADAAVDGIFFDYGIRIIGTSNVEFYINGMLRHRRRMTVSFGAVSMAIVFCHVCAGGADANMDVDYVWAASTR